MALHPVLVLLIVLLCQSVSQFVVLGAPALSLSDSNSIFDFPSAKSSPLTNDRSLLPGVQVFPQHGLFQQQQGRGIGSAGGTDLETWSKNQAVQQNQEHAVISQMAQMAPQKRNQLARDMANGNATAANEMVARVMRELAGTQHGLMAFPGLGLMDAVGGGMLPDPALLSSSSRGGFGNMQMQNLPLQLQIARQKQLLLQQNFPVQQPSTGFIPSSSTFGQFGPSAFFNNDRFGPQSLPSSADLSRPNPFSFPPSSSFAGQTQITPFSQSFFSGRTKNGNSNDFGRTLSGATALGQSGIGQTRTFDDLLDRTVASSSSGKGFVDDVTIENGFGRRRSMNSRDGIRLLI